MLISRNWLQNYVPGLESIEDDTLAAKVSSSLAEVETINRKGVNLSKIIVGEIADVTNHSSNEKYRVAKVNTGERVISIVFNSTDDNLVTKGSLYPVCLPGGTINGNNNEKIEINTREVEGTVSEGILCSPFEIGISTEKQLVTYLQPDVKVGDDLTALLKDTIFEIENKSLTHRPDAFSHRGMAREISAAFNLEFKAKEPVQLPSLAGNKPLKVNIKNNKACPRFSALTMENILVQESPTWLKVRLLYIGVKPVNNIVDISNFVMFDIGQPNHIYDYDKIKNNELIVRNANNGEEFKALNHKTYTLDKEMVVVAEADKVEDLAGIMGGEGSEVSKSTKNIIIEAASWDMFNIRKTSMKLGLQTDASTRFSKGFTPAVTIEAVQQVASLVSDIADGEIASEIIDIKNFEEKENLIEFNLNAVNRLIGIEIEKETIINILKSLDFKINRSESVTSDISSADSNIVELIVPPTRRDINIEQDIVEEVARIYGYNKVEPKLPSRSIAAAPVNQTKIYIDKFKNKLRESGLTELYTYSFVSKELYEKSKISISKGLKVLNPISPELEYFRPELLPSLLDKVKQNISLSSDEFGFFEISRVILSEGKKDIPNQPRKIAGVLVSKSKPTGDEMKSKIDYFLTDIADEIIFENLDGNIEKNVENIFHPLQSAIIINNRQRIGVVGNIHPAVKKNFGLEPFNVSLFDIRFKELVDIYKNQEGRGMVIDQTPDAIRDISFWVEGKKGVGGIINSIKSRNINYLKSVSVLDVYSEDEKRSVTLRFTIGKRDETLTEKQISEATEKIEEVLRNSSVELRS